MRWERSAAALGLLVLSACGRSYRDGVPTLGAAGDAAIGAGGDGNLAGGGVPPSDECDEDGDVLLEAPLATTSLTVLPAPAITLGQGFQAGDRPGEGYLRSPGCVTGDSTNAMLEHDSPLGTVVQGEGITPLAAADVQGFHFARHFLPPSLLEPFNAKVAEQGGRSLLAVRSASVQLWTYFLRHEQRTQLSTCGNAFVSSANPSQALVFAFKLTFPTSSERDTFSRCFTSPDQDIFRAADTSRASRYLVRHRVAVALHVLRAAGDADDIRRVLESSKCSAANLAACAITLDALEQRVQGIFFVPEPTTPLSQLEPTWGSFAYELAPLSQLP